MAAEARMAPAVYRVKELAALLDMGERQVREALIRGEIPGVRIGGQWRTGQRAFHAWLDAQEQRQEVENGEEHSAGVVDLPAPRRSA